LISLPFDLEKISKANGKKTELDGV